MPVRVATTVAVVAVLLGAAATMAAATAPTQCTSAQEAGYYCDHNQFATKYYWCAYPFANSYIPGWFDCAPGTFCTVAGFNGAANPCTPVPPTDLCPSDANKLAPGVCGCGVADTDTDGDGTADCNDACPSDANKLAPGVCGCGVADTDTDGDGAADCNDVCPSDANKLAPGVCGCGVADTDTDGDGTADCNDACPSDANKLAPGVCGCGVADTDNNSNQILDCQEPCPNAQDACCGLNNGFTCQGTQNTGMYVECSAPFFVGPRPCAPGTVCVASGFVTQNPCVAV